MTRPLLPSHAMSATPLKKLFNTAGQSYRGGGFKTAAYDEATS